MTQNTPAPQKWSSMSSIAITPSTLLLVDDDRVMRVMLQEAMTKNGYKVKIAGSGKEALTILKQDSSEIDALVLDREMPDLNGLEVVARMKADVKLAGIPIIMLTGTSNQDKIQEGIDAGVYYYLVKPANSALLCSVLESALRENRQKRALITELNRYNIALQTMSSCRIAVRTLTEAIDTSCFLASCFPVPERVVEGLMELLVNAVEHGNLGITYDEKHELLAANTWKQELDRRASAPENIGKAVEVIYQNQKEGHVVQITDCGPGFDWKRYWHINPARATASHGRGIARARMMAFDRMSYNEKGNSVTAAVMRTPSAPAAYAW